MQVQVIEGVCENLGCILATMVKLSQCRGGAAKRRTNKGTSAQSPRKPLAEPKAGTDVSDMVGDASSARLFCR